MFDASIRQRLHHPLDRIAEAMAMRGVRANTLTGVGFAVGVGACVAIVADRWWLALGMWLMNRLIDGLDGSVARRVGPTRLGGFLDIMADFAIYGGMLVAIGIAVPEARVATLVVFLSYYLNGAGFLAWSSLVAEKTLSDEGTDHEGDDRSLNFPAGLAEGTETIIAMAVILAFPGFTNPLMWLWAGIVGISVIQRFSFIVIGLSELSLADMREELRRRARLG